MIFSIIQRAKGAVNIGWKVPIDIQSKRASSEWQDQSI